MKLKAKIITYGELGCDEDCIQEVWVGDDEIYRVSDMTFNPEDAVIYRDLVSGKEYLAAVKKGMEYAKMGYDDIEIEEEERPRLEY